MTQRQFVLMVVDRDTDEFTVEGPMVLGLRARGFDPAEYDIHGLTVG